MDKIKYFASLDVNGIVENYSTINYSHSVIEYANNADRITNNYPFIGARYDVELNAFIPPKLDDTYILNTETYQWEPDPNIVYYPFENAPDTPYKWDFKLKQWYIVYGEL